VSTDDVQALVLEQFRAINTKLDGLPGLQAKIDLLDQSSREMGAELRTRDHAQQQAIELLRKEIADLRLDQHKMMAAIAGVSNTTSELNANLENQRKQFTTMEGQVRALYDTVMQTRRQMNELDKSFQDLESKVAGSVNQEKFGKLERQVQDLDKEVADNRPFNNGAKAFLRIAFYIAMTAIAGGALYWAAEAIIKALQ
jgi:chromosome segregation ATPase